MKYALALCLLAVSGCDDNVYTNKRYYDGVQEGCEIAMASTDKSLAEGTTYCMEIVSKLKYQIWQRQQPR